MLARSLIELRTLIDRELAELRLGAVANHRETVSVRDLLEDIEVAAAMEANARRLKLSVTPVPRNVSVHADRQVITSVVGNLLQNAFKFTRSGGHVVLRATATDARVLIHVEDECGGLPPGRAEDLFVPFSQRGLDRTGLGLGLSICERGARANDGEIRVRNLPGKGCVFTLELPRQPSVPEDPAP